MSENDEKFDRAQKALEGLSDQFYEGDLEGLFDSGGATVLGGESDTPLYDALSRLDQHYEERGLIGRGGMKEVFCAYDVRATREVALAKPLASLTSDVYDAFLREAHITARLEHPGIINLFDMGIARDGRPFFTMELKRGRSLREILKELIAGKGDEAFPLQRRLTILLRVCEALAYAHSRGVLHLDLKPENIQVGEFGEVQLCDWGMGVAVPGEEGDRELDVLLDIDLYGSLRDHAKGTPEYMAPEQFDLRQAPTVAMEVYALGCLLYELVGLQTPGKERGSLPQGMEGLEAMVAKACAENPADRYADVNAFRKDLQRYVDGYSPLAEGASLRKEAALFYRRNFMACNLILGALVVLCVAGVVFVAKLEERTQQAESALAAFEAEKEESARRLADRAEQARRSSRLVTQPKMLEEMLFSSLETGESLVDAILEKNPPPESEAWELRMWLSFFQQDFTFSNFPGDRELLKKTNPGLYRLASLYAPRLRPEGLLNAEDLVALLREVDELTTEGIRAHRDVLIEQILIYDLKRHARYRSGADRRMILQAVLEIINPEWKAEEDAVFRISRVGIKVSGRGLTRMRFDTGQYRSFRNVLRVLSPRALDLRGSGVSDVLELTGLELLELDVRKTPMKSLEKFPPMRSLRVLRVDEGQFSEEELKRLPDYIEVVIGDGA